ALYAFQVLPINYAGLALIVAGVLLIVAETFVPSFGILGIGGVVALVFGSIMLIDSDAPGMGISPELIGGIAAATSILFFILLYFVGRNIRRPRPVISQALVGEHAMITALQDPHRGNIRIHGELWFVESE